MERTSLFELVEMERSRVGDSSRQIYSSLNIGELDKKFQNTYAGNCNPLYLWSEKRVYFTVDYDGKVFISSVPRNPCTEEPQHS